MLRLYFLIGDNYNQLEMSHGRNECRIYVGNLPPDIRSKDIQDLFHKFGKVTFVDLKNRRGPPFAFVEFEDARYVYDLLINASFCLLVLLFANLSRYIFCTFVFFFTFNVKPLCFRTQAP